MDVGAARKRILELGRNYGLDVDPDELVADLGVGEKQRAEILKVLYRNARIIILDEPTAVLVPQEVDELFDSLRGLVARGVTIIFISHKLDEVLKVADAITVIRAGRTVAEVLPGDVTARDLAELMVGQRAPQARHPGVDRDRPGGAGRAAPDREGRRRPGARSTTCPSRSTGARSSASPASRGTGRPSSSRPSSASSPSTAGTVDLEWQRTSTWSQHAGNAGRGGSATSRRTASTTASCSARRCGRT